MVTDIRQTDRDDYWETLRDRWGALLSYRYIGRAFSSMNNSAVDESVPLRHDMRNPTGGILAAVLAITNPGGGGGKSDLEAVPNPVIHSQVILDPARDVKRIAVVESETLKDGRQFYFGRSKIVDADNPSRVIALVSGQGASIGDVPQGMQKFDDDPIDHIEDSPDLPPLWRVFGATKREDAHWALPSLLKEHASPDAALHIGPQHILLETAAWDLATELAATDRLQVEATTTMFMARGKVGPFRADGEAFAGTDGKYVVTVTISDEGSGDKPITQATYAYQKV